jgi:excisionase family DNA binding protein
MEPSEASPSPSPLPQLVDETSMIVALNISRRHLAELRARRLIPFVKLGRSVRFNPTAVAAAIEQLTVRPRQ